MFPISVIIPIYNQEQNIKSCIASLKKQTIPFKDMELILVNDGSEDKSASICRGIASRYKNVIYLEQENKGVSAARNLGIHHASGKYIFYLDADDQLESETIEKVMIFFDSVYDDVDLVTYPLDTIINKRRVNPHFRYRYLQKSGIYDLGEWAYIGQTTMNIAVKNLFENNVFFDESQTFSEDQRYCCDVLKDKLKMGFCQEGKYLYYRNPSSASGQLSGSCFIFEQCINFFEQLFAEYDKVPLAFQGLYVNDVYWKLINNILLPYHYEKDDYEHATRRICALLKECENEVIWNHPAIDFFEKYYLLRMKDKNNIQCRVNQESYCLLDGERLLVKEKSMELVVTKVRVKGTRVKISGFLKTVFFQFYEKPPTLCVIENGGKMTRKLKLFPSSHNYYLSHEATQRFWAMQYEFDASNVYDVAFEVGVGGYWFPIHYYFMPLVPFSHKYKRYEYQCDGIKLRIDLQNHIIAKRLSVTERKHIWLYYDCNGVEQDNGLLQFCHDITKKDGVLRYYVISDERQRKILRNERNIVYFGSRKHKRLFLQAEKIITAYIEENNFIPFSPSEYDKYSGNFCFDVIYLQHGVLHIQMPWKYSPEKIQADYVVVSTEQEMKLLIDNGFQEEVLWKTGMPRFEILNNQAKKQRKILFAPSWRSYLVEKEADGKWKILQRKFLASTYYRQIELFLKSQELEQLLEKYGYNLEVKLHPILSHCKEYFKINSDRIKFVDSVTEEESYSIFITDFSSYLYNFASLKIPILSFIPDLAEFKSGMNGYHDLNYSENYWRHVATRVEQLVLQLKDVLDGKNMNLFEVTFFDNSNSRENIYQRMIGEYSK